MADAHEVILTDSEMHIAATVGALRQIENIFKGRQHAYAGPRDASWQMHIEGAAGEQAFAKWSGRYWNGNLGDLDADDVGHVQVRTTGRPDGRLILHPLDPDDRPFVLVTGISPRFVLRGWIRGSDGKQQQWWRDPVGGRPAYFVPQSALRPMPPPRDSGAAIRVQAA
jgi:hypothetical protein